MKEREKNMRIAIVGSEGQYWTPEQRTKAIKEIVKIFQKHSVCFGDGNAPEYDYNVTLVTGGCGYTACDCKPFLIPGVDEWAEIVADVLGIQKDIHYAPARQWEDYEDVGKTEWGADDIVHRKGFRSRNIDIAETCDVLYCIDPKWRGERTGGQWTMRYAKKARKEVHLVEIE